MNERIKYFHENKKHVKFSRNVGKKTVKTTGGYIVGYSEDFILIQQSGDFELSGYGIFPVNQIKKIRHNKYDKCYDKIMVLEGEADKVGCPYTIDLSDWKSIFNSISEYKLTVTVECENPEIDSFTIGPIVQIKKKFVLINYFDPAGYLDDEPTSIDFESITYVQFDDRYANIFSKYLKKRRNNSDIAT